MSNYLDDNLNQSVFLDINFLDVLGDKTFEFCLYTLITHTLNLEEFDRRYKIRPLAEKPTRQHYYCVLCFTLITGASLPAELLSVRAKMI